MQIQLYRIIRACRDPLVLISSPNRPKAASLAEGSSRWRDVILSSVRQILSSCDLSSTRISAELAAPELAYKVQFCFALQTLQLQSRHLPLQAAALVSRLKTARTRPRSDNIALTLRERLDTVISPPGGTCFHRLDHLKLLCCNWVSIQNITPDRC